MKKSSCKSDIFLDRTCNVEKKVKKAEKKVRLVHLPFKLSLPNNIDLDLLNYIKSTKQ